MRRATEVFGSRWRCWLAAATLLPTLAGAAGCDKPVYLTFDTGHMAVAPLIADVLKRHDVKVTFFLANERTKTEGASLDENWAGWWRERAAEGHAFGSHTWDHDVWLADLPGARFRLRPTAGPTARQAHARGLGLLAEDQAPAPDERLLGGRELGQGGLVCHDF